MQERTLVVAFIHVGDGVCFSDSEEEEEANKFFRWMVTLHYFFYFFDFNLYLLILQPSFRSIQSTHLTTL